MPPVKKSGKFSSKICNRYDIMSSIGVKQEKEESKMKKYLSLILSLALLLTLLAGCGSAASSTAS